MEAFKQSVKDSDIVNIAIKENLDMKMFKYQNKKEFIKELEEIERAKNMKQYFTATELNDLLFISHLLDLSAKMGNEWLDRDNLLTEEANLLNMGASYLERFLETILTRMPQKEIEKFFKRTIRAKQDPVRIIDQWIKDRVFGTYETEYEIVKIERPQLEKLAMSAIEPNCGDCNSSYKDCDLYDILEDNLVPRAELKNNCPYSFISEQRKKEIEEKKNAKQDKKNKVSKRKAKKLSNRFDEDDSGIYEVNTKSKVV